MYPELDPFINWNLYWVPNWDMFTNRNLKQVPNSFLWVRTSGLLENWIPVYIPNCIHATMGGRLFDSYFLKFYFFHQLENLKVYDSWLGDSNNIGNNLYFENIIIQHMFEVQCKASSSVPNAISGETWVDWVGFCASSNPRRILGGQTPNLGGLWACQS